MNNIEEILNINKIAIIGRVKPAKKIKVNKVPRKRGRPAKGEQRQLLEKMLGQAIAAGSNRVN